MNLTGKDAKAAAGALLGKPVADALGVTRITTRPPTAAEQIQFAGSGLCLGDSIMFEGDAAAGNQFVVTASPVRRR